MFHKETTCSMTREEIDQTASNLLKRMTLKEKVWMLNGNWDIVDNQFRYKNGYNPVPIATNRVKRLQAYRQLNSVMDHAGRWWANPPASRSLWHVVLALTAIWNGVLVR